MEPDYFALARAITRHHFPTPSQARVMNDGRPTCMVCHAPCGLTREYYGRKMCETCYRDQPTIVQPKELLCRKN